MQPKLKRAELDRVAGHYGLDAQGVDALLEVAEVRPGSRDSLQFLARMLSIGGLLSLAAGVVFFVAANWSRIAVFGRFALLEILLVACVLLALFRLPPARLGRGALFLAFMITGALLALFGQTYQTGADVYELFLSWALLGLPLVLLANWSVSSAAWILVLNTSLMLFCSGRPGGGWLFWMLHGGRFSPGHVILAMAWLNLACWFLFELKPVGAVPEWVRRLMITCAFAFGTWAGVHGVDNFDKGALDLLGLLVTMIAVVTWAYLARSDIYPLALVMASFIIVSVVWLIDVVRMHDERELLVIAAWIIGSSTVASRVLAVTSRRWREQGAS